jgi:hypothetical protein
VSPRRTRTPLISAALAGLMALPVVMGAGASDAHADRVRVRVGGEVRVRTPRVRVRTPSVRVRVGGPRVRVSPTVRVRYRPYYRPYRYRYWTVGGSVYYGAGSYYASPPPPPAPRCDYECGGPTTVYSAPAVYAPAPLPRLGIGVFAGSMDVEGQEVGSDLGLLGRFRLTDHFQIEGELAKSEIADSTRVDRRVGGALLYDFSPRSRFSLNVLAGLGFSQSEIGGGDFSAEQGYGEVGVGLTWNLSRNLAISGDIRAGQRETTGDDIVLMGTVPQPVMQDEESYTRARLSAILFF